MMHEFVALPHKEKALYYQQASATGRINNPLIIEKDFWVTYVLSLLFSNNDLQNWFTFKGGTSLSKIYHVIDRFSEDVDVSIDRNALGYGGKNDPAMASSFTKTKQKLDELTEATEVAVREKILPSLKACLESVLGSDKSWDIKIDPDEKQTILFSFPTETPGWSSSYFKPDVKIEFGAKNESWPTKKVVVESYLSEAIPNAIGNKQANVVVLKAERTFWEKATILHSFHHGGHTKIRPNQSRHYYDLSQLAKSDICDKAIEQISLLESVATHKATFFRQGWAKYELARTGTLMLIPGDSESEKLLVDDYSRMENMFFSVAPKFTEVLDNLKDLENRINDR